MKHSKVFIQLDGERVDVQLHRDEYAGGGRAVWALVGPGRKYRALSQWTGRTEGLPPGAWYGRAPEHCPVMRALLKAGAVWRCERQNVAADPHTGALLVAYFLRGEGSRPVKAQYVPVRFRPEVNRRMINASFDGVRLETSWEVV